MAQDAQFSTPLPSGASNSDRRARLKALDEEMDALESRFRRLDAQRQIVAQALDSIRYPVLTLPPEVTAHIFSYYVDNPHIGYPGGDDPGDGPLPLASVCRSWRNICLSLHSLWSSLRVYPLDHSQSHLIRLLQCWLPRAGNHPVDLAIFRPLTSASAFDLLSSISQFSPQWRTLRLTLLAPWSFPNERLQGRLPRLSKLIINVLADRGVDPGWTITAFSDAPSLREVRLYGASLRCITLPWIQLTHLECKMESSDCVRILQRTPQLEVLNVLNVYFDNDSDPNTGAVALTHLHTLKFEYDRSGEILDFLTLPALKTIELSALYPGGPERFSALGLRSMWSLQSIHLMGMASKISNLCLRSAPSAEEVEIRHTSFEWPEDTLDELVELLHHDNAFLPVLRTMTLSHCTMQISVEPLAHMLLSRCHGGRPGVARLESFRLSFWHAEMDINVEEIKTGLRPLMDAGMEVEIGFNYPYRPEYQ
ncbi:hypothetical protein DFH07DRAFT_1068411 [Mycena maculata]|uniref:F-box domain-containing protein n=1 Tax=Mycena maculata TaxID=230809 RepID=A0AAD7MGF7_9AGAR|nr:hypothetical protein DFH07DRAFT_1068411 [Mycena maculata]